MIQVTSTLPPSHWWSSSGPTQPMVQECLCRSERRGPSAFHNPHTCSTVGPFEMGSLPSVMRREPMLSTRLQPYSHEDIFLQRYQWLRDWSLQLTEHNKEQAEDLVHDVFIQFTMARPDLGAIQNIDGYLYTMLRNMRLSNLRRAARAPSRPFSILEFDSAEVGLKTLGPRESLQLREQLWLICQYACVRKETSKAG